MTLWDLPPGQMATIGDYNIPDDAVAIRLQDLGFARGVRVECVRHVPFSGPRVYVVSGSVFALEKPVAVAVPILEEEQA